VGLSSTALAMIGSKSIEFSRITLLPLYAV